jgi:type IV pilus assembly protein PilE
MRNGFTLIELLLVVVVIGILAAFALPKFGDIKVRSYEAAMKNDLRAVVNAQEFYFEDNDTYATVSADLTAAGLWSASQGVAVVISGSDQVGYTATATHAKTDRSCEIEMGPTADQSITCSTPAPPSGD